jgi:hypothetical protein
MAWPGKFKLGHYREALAIPVKALSALSGVLGYRTPRGRDNCTGDAYVSSLLILRVFLPIGCSTHTRTLGNIRRRNGAWETI